MKQARLIGVLYLENNLASHVFTPARISLLELLASQAAISLENARLYGELTMSEERWRKLFESVPVGVVLVGSDRRYVAANPAFQKMTGYSEAELLRLSPADITHEDDRADYRSDRRRLLLRVCHTESISLNATGARMAALPGLRSTVFSPRRQRGARFLAGVFG